MTVEEDLSRVGSILQGHHFRYQSGKHGPNYINIDSLLPEALAVWELGHQLLNPYIGRFDVVACPATGGIPLGYAVAFQAILRGRLDVQVVFCEKDEEGNLVFDRATFANRVQGKRVYVVDDIMTNDNELGTVYRLCRLVESHDGTVIAVGLVCNRCRGTHTNLNVPKLTSLMEVDFEAFSADECPLCEQEVPIVEDVGHGAEHKAEHADYPGSYVKLLG